MYDSKSDSLPPVPRRQDINASLEDLTFNLDSLKSSIEALESVLSKVSVNRLEDSCSSKDGVSPSNAPSNASSIRKTIDDEVQKVKRLDSHICKLIDNLDL